MKFIQEQMGRLENEGIIARRVDAWSFAQQNLIVV